MRRSDDQSARQAPANSGESDDVRAQVEAILDSMRRDDLDTVLRCFTPDVLYKGGTCVMYPAVMQRQGRDGLAQALRAIHVEYEILETSLEQVVVEGEQAAALRISRLRHRGTGRTGIVHTWNFLRFRDGLICEFSEFPDTAAFVDLNRD